MSEMNNQVPILKIEDLKVYFPIKKGLMRRTVGHVRAVDGVDLQIAHGETLGLVGESGCGKTTIGRAIVRLNEPTNGRIIYNDSTDLLKLEGEELRQIRKKFQIVFQDPYSSLNPRKTVKRLISEVLMVQMGMNQNEAYEEVKHLMNEVGLNAVYASDFATLRAVVLVSALLYQLANLLADLAYAWLDPQVRLAR